MLLLILIGIVILVVIGIIVFGARYLFAKFVIGMGEQQERADRHFEQNTLGSSVDDGALQRKLSLLFLGRWVGLVAGAIMLVLPLVLLIAEGSMYLDEFLPYLLIAVLGAIILVVSIASMRRTKRFTTLIVRPVLQDIVGIDGEYSPFGCIPSDTIGASGLSSDFETVSGGDFVRGHYRGIPIMFSDVVLKKTEQVYNEETKKTEDKTVILFKGYWMVADFDRALTTVPLIVREERSGSRCVKMESEAFNRQFSVYCSDAHNAFYILTPHFMERLVEADSAADGQSAFSFIGNRMQIAVSTKSDLFEAGMFTVPKVADMRERFRREVSKITGVLDEMLKNERLFGGAAGTDK